MKKECLVVCTLILVLSLSWAFVAAEKTGEETVKFTIGRIRTAGNRVINTADILSKVRSRIGDLFDADTAAEDAKRIAELSGVEYSYYSTAVVGNEIQLTFVVVERNIIRSISFVGNRKYKAKTLRKKVGLKVGEHLDPTVAGSAVRTLTEFYQKKGFAFVEVKLDGEQLSYGKLVYRIDEGPRVRTTAVKFSGNDAIKTKELAKAIKTRKRKWLVLPGYYVQDIVAGDVTRLQNIYQKKGFLDAKITEKRQFNVKKNKVNITFVINEGPVYTVKRILITGIRHFDEEKLRGEIRSEEEQVYNKLKGDADVRRLLKLYRENGFIDAKVEQRTRFISRDSVNVGFEITEGERFRIGQINITGNEHTQDKVVRRVLDEYDFQPGKWWDADTACGDGSGYLERMVRRMAVTDATIRESATITPSGEMPGQRDAQVNIIEGRTGMVMLGAGVASDSGIIGQLIFEQRNFDIKDRPESFYEFITGKAFRGAGQTFRIALQPGTEVSEYSVSFTEPYFRDRPISLDVVGSSWGRSRESYDEQRTKGYVGFEKRYKNRWRRSIGFRVENVEVDDIDYDAPKEITDDKGDNALFGVRLGIGRDLTDEQFNPTKGSIINASYEQVGGDHSFGILRGVYRRYTTLHEDLAERKTVLGVKLLGATTVGNAPVFEKFYAGGSGIYGMRGFDYRGISTRGVPRIGGVPVTGGKKKDPIGSDWIFLANAEVAVPLVSDNFAALFFVDSGMIDSGGYRASVGMGVQILIPQWFGPVPMRFEIAAPLMKDGEDDTQIFSFSVGRLF